MFVLPLSQFNSRCLLGVNYTAARHRDETHTPIEYASHSGFVPSEAMSTLETNQTAVGGAREPNVAD